MSLTTPLAPVPTNPTTAHYLVETTTKRGRTIRASYSTREEAEAHKNRINERWQPAIHVVRGDTYTTTWTTITPKSDPTQDVYDAAIDALRLVKPQGYRRQIRDCRQMQHAARERQQRLSSEHALG